MAGELYGIEDDALLSEKSIKTAEALLGSRTYICLFFFLIVLYIAYIYRGLEASWSKHNLWHTGIEVLVLALQDLGQL